MATVVPDKKWPVACFLILFLFMAVLKGLGQQACINLQKMVAIPGNSIPLDSLLHLMNKQAGVKFSLNTRKIPPSKRIQITKQRQSIKGVLEEIKLRTGVYYAILGDHIILIDNPPRIKNAPASSQEKNTQPIVKKRVPSAVKKTVIKKNNPPSPALPSPGAKVESKADTGLPHNIVEKDTTHTTAKAITAADSSLPKPVAKIKRTDTIISPSQNADISTAPHVFFRKFFAKGGLNTEDIFYVSPAIQAGWHRFYGIVSYNTNFKASQFRYGAGFYIPLNGSWNIHMQVTTGKLRSPEYDTLPRTVQLKTRLHRAAFLFEANLGTYFTIQFGPVFNMQQSAFYRNGASAAPGFSEEKTNNIFQLIHPGYTIYNNYQSDASRFTKLWIGGQAGIFYHLFSKRE